MCGIVGVVLRGAGFVEKATVTLMADTLAHRGPDGEGLYLAPGVGFGHRRLSVVDLSPAAAQPMVGPTGAVLTFNGEIYNWHSVRRLLAQRGREVRSSGDTEVLLAALETWGEGAFPRLEGMFAFAYWDPARRALLLARDRFGEKPLYYAPLGGEDGGDGLVFASELRALLEHPRVRAERAVDAASVAQYFLHEFVPAPRSIFTNVRKLPAGHLLRWSDGGRLSVEPYYVAPTRAPRSLLGAGRTSARELEAELIRRTEEATRARLVADVPVGVFLSGGLDSSFLAACATRVASRVKTFTVSFDDASFDESRHARVVAEHLGTEHIEHRLSEATLLDVVPSMLDWMDEPFADSSLLPTMLLAREARRDVTVALGGEGGDELLAGYPTFIVDVAGGRVPPLPAWLARGAQLLANALPADPSNFSASFKARQLVQGLDAQGARRHASWLAAMLPSDLARVAGPRLGGGALAHAFDAVDRASGASANPFDAATAFYLKVYLGEGVLTKVDRATMRASLEARAPLLDTAVAELCLSLPRHFRVRGGTTKWLMRRAVRSLLPASIVARPKKGFGAPVGAWMRGPLRDLAETTLSAKRVDEGGWLDGKSIGRMLKAHTDGTAELRKPLYAALVFEHWRQRSGL